MCCLFLCFFFSSRRRHTRCLSDWSSDVCSSDLRGGVAQKLFARLDSPATARQRQQQVELDGREGDLAAGEFGHARGGIHQEIGRASCRERGENEVGAGAVERREKERACKRENEK